MSILTEDCITNVLGHIKACWRYDYPTGKTLENAFFEGIKPFYSDANALGAPSTIVDVGKESTAFDIKGCKVLGHVKKEVKSSNLEKNIFIEQNVPGKGRIKIRIPQSVLTQVRRPKVDLMGYQGDPKSSLDEQISDYHQFAMTTTSKDGYQELFSVVLLYGIDEKKGFKSVFLSIDKFNIPEVVDYEVGTKEDKKTPCSYQGKGKNGEIVFSLSSFNKGSSNFHKRFYVSSGHLMTWPIEEQTPIIFTKDDLEQHCAIQTI